MSRLGYSSTRFSPSTPVGGASARFREEFTTPGSWRGASPYSSRSPYSGSPSSPTGYGLNTTRMSAARSSSIFGGSTRSVSNDDHGALLTSAESAMLALVDREGHEHALRKKVVDSLHPDELSERYLKRYTVSCPGCGIATQRDAFAGGCPSVTCANCNTRFRCEVADF